MKRKFGLLMAFGLAALMAACAPAAAQPTEEQPTDEPTSEVTDEPTEAPEVEETAEQPEVEIDPISQAAVTAAQAALAAHLSVDVDETEVVLVEHVEWSDGCLGLGGPEEMCLMAITPGWRIVLRAGESEYEVRTDETGASVRVNTGGVSSSPTE